jgi:hypothetical protein
MKAQGERHHMTGSHIPRRSQRFEILRTIWRDIKADEEI